MIKQEYMTTNYLFRVELPTSACRDVACHVSTKKQISWQHQNVSITTKSRKYRDKILVENSSHLSSLKKSRRDSSSVEKDHTESLRMPLGDVLSLSKYMRTNTKPSCIPNGMLCVVVEHFLYQAIIPNGIKKERIFFTQLQDYKQSNIN